MKALKSARTLAASLGVLAFGALAASPAMAFDDVDWDWKKDIREKVDIDVYIDVDVESTGLVEVEKLQIFLGNVYAQSSVSWIKNEQYDRDQYFDPIFGYKYCGCYYGYWFDVDELPFDALIDLPHVVSAATAVGNNQSITSDVPVFLHDGQFVANSRYNYDIWDLAGLVSPYTGGGWGGDGCKDDCDDGNLHTDLAILFTLGAAFGFLAPADIHAYSYVDHIWNATVDSSATAVANNISVSLESDVDGVDPCKDSCTGYGDRLSNHLVIADITQFAYANVSAYSDVHGVYLNEYTNLNPDVLGKPIVSSVATAIGNNVSINVGPVPAPESP